MIPLEIIKQQHNNFAFNIDTSCCSAPYRCHSSQNHFDWRFGFILALCQQLPGRDNDRSRLGMQPQTACCQLKLTIASYLRNQPAAIDLNRPRNQQPNPSQASPNGTHRSVSDSLCLFAYRCSPITVVRRTKQ